MRKLLHALIAGVSLALLPLISSAGVFVGVSVNVAPPVLPVYAQPVCPGIGYIWIPGYWAWDGDDYYWVPGTWALAPAVGLLWTPGYWGWDAGFYVWHGGYWGPHVGFYGGINYGFGYGGVGYEGGYWRGNDFYYNRSVNNITNVNITNVYNRTVVNNVTVNRVSFNGGQGGIVARPSAEETRFANERHIEPTPMQREHQQMARGDHSLRASVNGGRPPVAATVRPAVFTGRGVVAARGAGAATHASATRPSEGAPRRNDRPPQAQLHSEAQHPQAAPRGAVERADRPPQAGRPAMPPQSREHAYPGPGPQGNQAYPAHPARPAAERAPARGAGGYSEPRYPQSRGPMPGGGGGARQAPPREHPQQRGGEREQRREDRPHR